ncbi:hypothetical protein, partial [Acinetobacter baumannii]|uniref:hypothetical protein n=1 Tax=Acinetobacter baumannii TaxID=470 RepID=UPI001C09078E
YRHCGADCGFGNISDFIPISVRKSLDPENVEFRLPVAGFFFNGEGGVWRGSGDDALGSPAVVGMPRGLETP